MKKLFTAALLSAPLTVAAAQDTPSTEEMWRIIQQQQTQIESMKQKLEENKQRLEEARARLGTDDDATDESVATRLEQQERQLDATADALENMMASGTGGGDDDTAIGGYGELHYNNLDDGEEMDFHRFVLFVNHQFRKDLNFYSELEVEHSLAGDGEPGEVELEQAFVEWDYAANHSAKFGLFLLPIGILNETHEPDTFYGVERNLVEKRIIPTTWWEGGAGLSGEIAPGWSYDLALHSGLSNDAGNIRSGRQKVAEANADSLAYTGRIRYSGIPGLQWSASVQRQQDLTQNDSGVPAVGDIGATLLETNVTLERGMFGLRALYARWDLDDEVTLVTPGADEQTGWYIEPSVRLSESVGFFARYGTWDTTAGSSVASNEKSQFDVGVNYWLHPNVVLKADFQRQDNDNGEDNDGFNLGVGYSF